MAAFDSARKEPPGAAVTTADTSFIRQLEQATDPWSFVETLRALRSTRRGEVWLAARDARTSVLWLRGDAVTYTADATTVQSIRRGSIRLSRLGLQETRQPVTTGDLRSGLELSWFAGYHASLQLTPRLRADACYRVAGTPNFGWIRPLPSQLRVAASVSNAAATVGEIVSRAGVPVEEVVRTLNALYACDLLEVRPAADAQPAEAPEAQRGGLKKLLVFAAGVISR